ncbi:hypothetical protein EV198_3757 [Roseivirga ehrenbergii]|uniref:Uncharacterized protein n=1 Tax=Roseivirga ehrenbergii (strain DSM 102268 / JCM 13514 / KCTC 12282 / NCIMB 14502 / KMM 6017) TaxID=279360 RepID=A0A150XNC5_ROSEK|nr:hypothetical protein [Roseivirga ehrenbergii]KYG80191.1 hypothetical protein MB14_16760 [Roseivirga ehrenbergii]TCK99222.1 hypothetical protein EV198_3757 [Roseivirga ehrenbergii]
MLYTREELDKVSDPKNTEPGSTPEILSELLRKLYAGEKMLLSEQIAVCNILPILHSSEDDSTLNPYDFPELDIAQFLRVHSTYFRNLNGHYPAHDWKGEIPREQVIKDIAFLNRHYEEWKELISKTNHKSELLIMALSETNNQLKDLIKYQKRDFVGSNLAEYQKKSTTLFGKKAYYLLQEYYEFKDKNFIEFEVSGVIIRIDAFGYFHTLTRHFSALTRDHLDDKDFHIDNVNYRYLPDNIETILLVYDKPENKYLFDNNHLMFSIGGKPYSIRFKKMNRPKRGGGEIEYYRFQTFYPVSDPNELRKFNSIKRLDFPPFKTAFNTRSES